MKYLILFLFSSFAYGACDFEDRVPDSWITFISLSNLPIHMYDLDKYSCETIREYQLSQNTLGTDILNCENIDISNHPVLKVIKDGDMVGYFASPKECRENYSMPIYSGYVVFRNSEQVAFELVVGSHNKALNSPSAGTAKSAAR